MGRTLKYEPEDYVELAKVFLEQAERRIEKFNHELEFFKLDSKEKKRKIKFRKEAEEVRDELVSVLKVLKRKNTSVTKRHAAEQHLIELFNKKHKSKAAREKLLGRVRVERARRRKEDLVPVDISRGLKERLSRLNRRKEFARHSPDEIIGRLIDFYEEKA